MDNTQNTTTVGRLYYGDNLNILRHKSEHGEFDYIGTESIDVIYLDPPFQSGRNYNMIFRDREKYSDAQVMAFADTWKWTQNTSALHNENLLNPGIPEATKTALRMYCGDDSGQGILGHSEMAAYLTNMAPRLYELMRPLKSTGSMFLHCDPRASHYIKTILDTIYGLENFRAEIIWHYGLGAANRKRDFLTKHDVILVYSKTQNYKFRMIRGEPTPQMLAKYCHFDDNGRYMMSYGRKYYMKGGKPLDDVWDIPALSPTDSERLGYPTQKPLRLLERIILGSTDPGDTVLDPFCGCGTATEASQKLGRNWIGIDLTHLAINLIRNRLSKYKDAQFDVIGEPVDVAGASALADGDKYQFQWWALSLINALPYKHKKKGKDDGIDGILTVVNPVARKTYTLIVSVKGGRVITPSMVRDLKGTVEREKGHGGIFITLKEPSDGMRKEASIAGVVDDPYGRGKINRIQIYTIRELLEGAAKKLPVRNIEDWWNRNNPEQTISSG